MSPLSHGVAAPAVARRPARARRRRPALAALLAVAAATSAAPAAAAPQRLMLVGDSITQGSSGDSTWRYRLWQSLQREPSADSEPVDFVGDRTGLFNPLTRVSDGNHDYVDPAFDQDHHALWNRTLFDEQSTIAPAIAALPAKPTAMVVDLGTNDAARGGAGSITLLRTLITRARAAAPGLDVVVARLYPLYNFSARVSVNAAYVADFNARLPALAAQLSTPAEQVVVADSDRGFDASTMTWDGRHPTPAGESVLAAAFATALQSIGIGTGWRGDVGGQWPATGPSLTIPAPTTNRLALSWSTVPPGALSLLVQQRSITADAAAGGAPRWSIVAALSPAARTWASSVLTTGQTYAFRLVPTKGTMTGSPGPAASAVVPAPRPWWQWW